MHGCAGMGSPQSRSEWEKVAVRCNALMLRSEQDNRSLGGQKGRQQLRDASLSRTSVFSETS